MLFLIKPLRRSRSAGTLVGPLQAMLIFNEGGKDKGTFPKGKARRSQMSHISQISQRSLTGQPDMTYLTCMTSMTVYLAPCSA